jgi:hypothetical protein
VKKNCRHVAKYKLAEEFRHSREYKWGEIRRGKYEHDENFMGTGAYNNRKLKKKNLNSLIYFHTFYIGLNRREYKA